MLGYSPHEASVLPGGVLSENKVLLGKPTAPLEPPLQAWPGFTSNPAAGPGQQVVRVKLRVSL